MDAPTLPDSLRMVADFLEAHPDFTFYGGPTLTCYAADAEQFARLVRQLGGTINAPAEKAGDDDHLFVTRQFGRAAVQVFTTREATCERVQVGVETVEVPIMEQVGVEVVERPVYEWDCAPVLA